MGGGILNALIQHHNNVRAQCPLDLHSLFGRQRMWRTVQVRTEFETVFPHPSQALEAHHLIAAAIGKDRTRPAHELVQAAQVADQFVPRTQVEVIGVGENNLGANLLEQILRHAFDSSGSPDRHEDGRFHIPVRSVEYPRARRRCSVPRQDFKTASWRHSEDVISSEVKMGRGRMVHGTIEASRLVVPSVYPIALAPGNLSSAPALSYRAG